MVETFPSEKITSAALKKWGSEVVGIALFGSFVRGKKDFRDIDALIVLEKIDKSRIERIKDIVELKRALDFPADILLVSKKECRDNFKNHNPLFLDIATEGEIIYDRGFLDDLINETKLDIKEKKIKKVSSRWIFPVKDRVPTPLSEITNKDWANYWLEDSQRDLKAAEYLSQNELYERAVYHCQQAVEKTVKAVLICFGAYEKTHYVASILRKEVEKRDLKEYSKELNNIINIAEKEYKKEIAESALKDAKEALKIGNDFVKWWFENK